MNPFLDNLGGFMFNDERLLSLRNLSLTSLIYKLFYFISPALAQSTAFSVVSWCSLVILFVTATVTAVFTRSDFSRSVIAAGIIILVPTVSYFYVLVFSFIPLMELIRTADELSNRRRMLYTICFLFLFCTILLLPQIFIPHTFIIITMLLLEEITVIRRELLPRMKARKTESI